MLFILGLHLLRLIMKKIADYYASEQQINEELEQINLIMCFMKIQVQMHL